MVWAKVVMTMQRGAASLACATGSGCHWV